MIIDLLIETVESLGYPVIRQGSLSADEEYPNTFFTFWNNETYSEKYYDNDEYTIVYNFDLNCYSINPTLIYELIEEVKILLKNKHFIVSGVGYDVASDEITHTGRGINVLFLEFKKGEM